MAEPGAVPPFPLATRRAQGAGVPRCRGASVVQAAAPLVRRASCSQRASPLKTVAPKSSVAVYVPLERTVPGKVLVPSAKPPVELLKS